MVKQQIKPVHRPIPVSEKVRQVAYETIEAIRRNFSTQCIFPRNEVYAGWFEKNSRAKGSTWQSTGAGYDSFHFSAMHVAEQFDVGVRNWSIEFIYNYYLKFAEMGVGKGRPWSQVEHTLSATSDLRYLDSWNPEEGSTHRPAIMMEFRHQAGRLQRYMANRYKYDATMYIVNSLDGLDLQVGSGAENSGNNT